MKKLLILVGIVILAWAAPSMGERIEVYDKSGMIVQSYDVVPNYMGGVRVYDNKNYRYVDVYGTREYGEPDGYDQPLIVDPGSLFQDKPRRDLYE